MVARGMTEKWRATVHASDSQLQDVCKVRKNCLGCSYPIHCLGQFVKRRRPFV